MFIVPPSPHYLCGHVVALNGRRNSQLHHFLVFNYNSYVRRARGYCRKLNTFIDIFTLSDTGRKSRGKCRPRKYCKTLNWWCKPWWERKIGLTPLPFSSLYGLAVNVKSGVEYSAYLQTQFCAEKYARMDHYLYNVLAHTQGWWTSDDVF